MGVRPDSPSRSDTFLLVCVAARLWRDSRSGSNVGRRAQTPPIRASFVYVYSSLVGSIGSSAIHNRDGCARRQAPPRAKLRHGLGLHRGNRAVRRLGSTTMHLSRTAAAGRHTKTRGAHPITRAAVIVFFSGFLMRQYIFDVTGFCSMAVSYTLHGARPPAILRNVVALCVLSQTVRETL